MTNRWFADSEDWTAHLGAIKRACLAGTLVFGVIWVVTVITVRSAQHELSLSLRTNWGTAAEIYYAHEREEYDEERKVPFAVVPDGEWHDYVISLPTSKQIVRLRVDTAVGYGRVSIGGIRLRSPRGATQSLTGTELTEAIRALNDAVVFSTDRAQDAITIDTLPRDPYVDFAIPQVRGNGQIAVLAYALGGAVVAFVGTLMFTQLVRRAKPGAFARCFRTSSRRWAARLTDPGVVAVDETAVVVLGCLLIAAIGYVALGLHQSSIGMWETMYPPRPVDQLVEIGAPRAIRSDEWNTQTPWVLNQVARGAAVQNENIGGENAPLLAAVPVLRSVAAIQPKYLGFLLFDVTRGFSWWWAYKTLGLVAAYFWLLLILTHGNTWISLIGSGWLFFSSFSQWWLSSNLPEILIGFATAVIGALYVLRARRRRWIILGASLCSYAVITLLLHLYPPFILPLAYLGAFVLAGVLLLPDARLHLVHNYRFRLMAVGSFLLGTGALIAGYLVQADETIHAMVNTVYPGTRLAVPGTVSIERALYGWFEAFRFGESRIPANTGNACEASSFVIAFPLAMLALRFRGLVARQHSIVLALSTYAVFVLCWMCLPIPDSVTRLLQRAGWSWSPPDRSLIGLGVASILLTTLIASAASSDKPGLLVSVRRRWIPLCAALVIGLFGWALDKSDPVFMTPVGIGAAIVLAVLLARGVALGRLPSLAAGVALLSIPAASVNPITSGLSGLLEKPVLVAGRAHGAAPDHRWAVIGDFVFAQGLKAQGLDVVNGSHILPNKRNIDVLDPSGVFGDVWNRYAHVVLESAPGFDAPTFTLRQADLYVVSVDVCGPQFRALGVDRIAYTGVVPEADHACLIPISGDPTSGVSLFRLRSVAEDL